MNSSTPVVWYKEPWAWAIVGILGFSVVSGLTMLTIALKYGDSVVTDNYYRDGLLYNQRVQEDELAASLGIEAHLSFEVKNETISLTLNQDSPEFENQLILNLYSPIDADMDQFLILQHQGNGTYSSRYIPGVSPRYQIEIRNLSPGKIWRLKSHNLFMDDVQKITLNPGSAVSP